MCRVLGIDVGGTNTRYGIVTHKTVSSVEKLLSKNIQNFPEFVAGLVKENPDIDVISIGIPGIVKDNKILSLPNLKELEIKDLDEQINKLTNKRVVINKDVNLLFMNDLDRLNLTHQPNVLGFYIGTGLGNSIKVNGKLHFGSNGFAGELGHFPIIGNKRVCGCGKIGCSETIVSGKALVGIHKENNLEGEISEIFTKHRDNPVIKDFVKTLGLIMSIEINILDILKLIIGGGVINMKDFPKNDLLQVIKENLRSQSLINDLEVYFVDDSPINSIIGASLIIKE